MDWLPALIGSLIGATIPSSIAVWNSKRVRSEDAYAEFAGACHLLIRVSRDDDSRLTNDAWIRFGIARARLIFQERDEIPFALIRDLTAEIGKLYWVTLDANGEELAGEAKVADVLKHYKAQQNATATVDQVLFAVRDRR